MRIALRPVIVTVFAHESPEAAGRLHWKVYREARPRGLDEAQAPAEDLRFQGDGQAEEVGCLGPGRVAG